MKISPARQQLIGVKVAAVEKKPMTYTLRLYGRVVADETRTYRVNASTDCWIRELSDVTTGSIVRKNQILAEALAPSYYNAQVTYLIALDNIDRIKQQLGGQLRHQQGDLANNQIRVAVQALQNLGITDAQTEELANTRQARPYLQVRAPADGVVLSRKVTLNQWFKAAEEFYTIADIGKVWVYADVYEDEAMHMRPGMTVAVKHAQMGKTFSASVGEVLPLFDPAARTLKVRIDVDNPRYDLRPDMFVDVEIPITMPPSLNVPADAVLDAGTRALVYVDAGGGVFEPRRVETGWRLGGRVEITARPCARRKNRRFGQFPDRLRKPDGDSLLWAGMQDKRGPGLRPICGPGRGGNDGADASHENETFYFDSEACKEKFEKEPEKYVRKQTAGRKHRGSDRSAMSGMKRKRGWTCSSLSPASGIAKPQRGAAESEAKDFFGGPKITGIVDWNGPEKEGAPPREWSRMGGVSRSQISRDQTGSRKKLSGRRSNPGAKASRAHECDRQEAGAAERQRSGARSGPDAALERGAPGIRSNILRMP